MHVFINTAQCCLGPTIEHSEQRLIGGTWNKKKMSLFEL